PANLTHPRLQIARGAQHMPRTGSAGLLSVILFVLVTAGARGDDALDYFEREVRPVLVDTCQKCHGAKKQSGGLSLETRERLLRGGASGPAIVPGRPEKSLLISAIHHDGDLKMPPKSKLTEAQIAALTRWVQLGAPWPRPPAVAAAADAVRTHWAFRPVK